MEVMEFVANGFAIRKELNEFTRALKEVGVGLKHGNRKYYTLSGWYILNLLADWNIDEILSLSA